MEKIKIVGKKRKILKFRYRNVRAPRSSEVGWARRRWAEYGTSSGQCSLDLVRWFKDDGALKKIKGEKCEKKGIKIQNKRKYTLRRWRGLREGEGGARIKSIAVRGTTSFAPSRPSYVRDIAFLLSLGQTRWCVSLSVSFFISLGIQNLAYFLFPLSLFLGVFAPRWSRNACPTARTSSLLSTSTIVFCFIITASYELLRSRKSVRERERDGAPCVRSASRSSKIFALSFLLVFICPLAFALSLKYFFSSLFRRFPFFHLFIPFFPLLVLPTRFPLPSSFTVCPSVLLLSIYLYPCVYRRCATHTVRG